MSISGWIVMSISIGSVTTLFIWCLWKVLTTRGETEHMHGFEIDPKDLD